MVSFNRYLAQIFGGPNPEYGEYALKVVKIKRVFFPLLFTAPKRFSSPDKFMGYFYDRDMCIGLGTRL
jgi:hypothetical protein